MLNEDNPYEISSYVDTGCYVLNALLSDGDIEKGLPDGKKIMISGEASTAKSLFTTFILGAYARKKKNSRIVFFETEGSTIVQMAKSVGIPEKNMLIIPINTVEECRTEMVNILDKIIDDKEGFETYTTEAGEVKRKPKKDHKPSNQNFIFCLDSLGMLSTLKETTDIKSGSTTRDMTRAQLIKGMSRVLSLKLSVASVPLMIVNHTYSTMDKYKPQEASGGSGPKYMSDIHLMLSKSKNKVGKEQIGVKVKVLVAKSRFMIENKSVSIYIDFKRGIRKLSSLVQLAHDLKIFKKEGISYILPDGQKVKMKEVRENTKKYMNETNLQAIRDGILDDFGFCNLEEKDDNLDSDIEEKDDENEM